jgi:FAD/FMN-containing dehydrogenase
MATAARTECPGTVPEASELLRSLGDAGTPVRVRGGGTKSWGPPATPPAVELSSAGMARILEHNEGDFTAGPR